MAAGESWSEADPSGAAEYAAQLPTGKVRQAMLRQAISQWITGDLEAANEWLVRYTPHEDFDEAISSLATANDMIRKHRDLALAWTGVIHSEQLRIESLSRILSSWGVRDTAAATNYARNLPSLSPELRERLVQAATP